MIKFESHDTLPIRKLNSIILYNFLFESHIDMNLHKLKIEINDIHVVHFIKNNFESHIIFHEPSQIKN